MKTIWSCHGISTLEALAALGLFAITAAGLAATTIAVTRQSTRIKVATAGTALVEDWVEQLRTLDPAKNRGNCSQERTTTPTIP